MSVRRSRRAAGEHRTVVRDLRAHVAAAIIECADIILAGAGSSPFTPADADAARPEPEALVLKLLAWAIEDGDLNRRTGAVAHLHQLTAAASVEVVPFFSYVYLVEQSAIDELANHRAVGMASESWASASQLVRRASFDLLAVYAARLHTDPTGATLTDPLTTVHSRAVFHLALAKELQRAGRCPQPLAVLLFDVDRLDDLNQRHGERVGDRVLERLGILLRRFFRAHDWVARYHGDSFAVLLSPARPAEAVRLAERALEMIEQRLSSRDHSTGRPLGLTLSGAIVTAEDLRGHPADPDRILVEAESALARAKQQGGNRIERVDLPAASLSVAQAARRLRCSTTAVRELIAAGILRTADRQGKRPTRAALDEYRARRTLERHSP